MSHMEMFQVLFCFWYAWSMGPDNIICNNKLFADDLKIHRPLHEIAYDFVIP